MSIPHDACPFRLLKCASQSHKQAAASGSVLLAVMCLLAVLSFLIITTAAMSREHGEMQQARTSMMRARQLAESGIALAAHPLIKAGDPLLRNNLSSIESYAATLTTEERLLNLNALLTAERLPLLERIFMSWGLPLNRPFATLHELNLVARVEELNAAKPDWRTWFTLRSNGQLDVNTASAEILTGATLESAEKLVSTRTGPNGAPLKSLEEAVAILGIAGSDTSLMTLSGPTRRVESIGRAGDAQCGIALVLDHKGGIPRMLEWREFSVKGIGLP